MRKQEFNETPSGARAHGTNTTLRWWVIGYQKLRRRLVGDGVVLPDNHGLRAHEKGLLLRQNTRANVGRQMRAAAVLLKAVERW